MQIEKKFLQQTLDANYYQAKTFQLMQNKVELYDSWLYNIAFTQGQYLTYYMASELNSVFYN